MLCVLVHTSKKRGRRRKRKRYKILESKQSKKKKRKKKAKRRGGEQSSFRRCLDRRRGPPDGKTQRERKRKRERERERYWRDILAPKPHRITHDPCFAADRRFEIFPNREASRRCATACPASCLLTIRRQFLVARTGECRDKTGLR